MRYRGKKVLILGLGVNQGGLGAAKFFAKLGAKLIITDLKNKGQLKPSLDQLKDFSDITYHLGKHDYADLDWADIIIINQALKPDNPYRQYAEKSGKEVETDIGIFLNFVKPGQLVGITGTKGKSTTSSLIYEVLKNSKQKVLFAGNIGKSVLDTLDYVDEKTLVVLEISSFQLEAFDKHKVSPHITVITNIYPDHLNYYKSMDEYIQSKKLIAKHQTQEDVLFLNKENTTLNSEEFTKGIRSKINYFSPTDLPQDFAPILPGEHNRANMAAALQVAHEFGIKEKEALEIMKNFKGVDFRLQLVKEWKGIKIYNDTAATTPDAAIQAIKSLPNSLLIAGGMNKGLSFDHLAKEIDRGAKAVFFIDGDATDEIKKHMQNQDLIKGTYNNFEDLLQDIKEYAKEGDVIILSPGATSFNFFQNEFDRGRKFNQAVERIFIQ